MDLIMKDRFSKQAMEHPDFNFINPVVHDYLHNKKKNLHAYKACKAYCLGLSQDEQSRENLYNEVTDYLGHFSLFLIERHGFDLWKPPASLSHQVISEYARDVAMALNIKKVERSCSGIVSVAYLLLDIYCPESSQSFMDELVQASENAGPAALKNLLFSPWEKYSDLSRLTAQSIKSSLCKKGELVNVLESLVGQENLKKCHKRLGFDELLPFTSSKVKRNVLEQDLGL